MLQLCTFEKTPNIFNQCIVLPVYPIDWYKENISILEHFLYTIIKL